MELEERILRYIGARGSYVTVRQLAKAMRVPQSAIVDAAYSTHTLEVDNVAVACGNAIAPVDNPGDWHVLLGDFVLA